MSTSEERGAPAMTQTISDHCRLSSCIETSLEQGVSLKLLLLSSTESPGFWALSRALQITKAHVVHEVSLHVSGKVSLHVSGSTRAGTRD